MILHVEVEVLLATLDGIWDVMWIFLMRMCLKMVGEQSNICRAVFFVF